jgi:hypothetical protein
MTAEEFARLLDGREYGDEMSKEENELAAENRLFVFFGSSDDNLEIRGIIDDEIGAYEGVGVEIDIAKTLNTPYQDIVSDETKKAVGKFVSLKTFTVEAVWNPESLDTSWLITTDVPHATFDIMEDGDLFCRGIVVTESDVLEYLNNRENV